MTGLTIGTAWEIINTPIFLRDGITATFTNTIEGVRAGRLSTGHLLWVYPANATFNLANTALIPVVAVANFGAAAILAPFALYSNECNMGARYFFFMGAISVSDHLFTSLLRINDPFYRDPETVTNFLNEYMPLPGAREA